MSNILTLSISELVSKLKSGDISSVELCSAYIDRYDKFEKDVKAWAYFDKKLLLEKATEADENRKAGKPLGQLHGLPIGVKDIFGTLDMPTECGTVIRKNDRISRCRGCQSSKDIRSYYNGKNNNYRACLFSSKQDN